MGESTCVVLRPEMPTMWQKLFMMPSQNFPARVRLMLRSLNFVNCVGIAVHRNLAFHKMFAIIMCIMERGKNWLIVSHL